MKNTEPIKLSAIMAYRIISMEQIHLLQRILIRRLWLDNYFYGGIFSLQNQKNKTHFTFGGGWNEYDGKHYDIVTWAQQGFPKNYTYFNMPANKRDLNLYAKLLQTFGSGFSGFVDVQGRFVNYKINGFESNPEIIINKNYTFFNPKAGISFNKNNYQAYAFLFCCCQRTQP